MILLTKVENKMRALALMAAIVMVTSLTFAFVNDAGTSVGSDLSGTDIILVDEQGYDINPLSSEASNLTTKVFLPFPDSEVTTPFFLLWEAYDESYNLANEHYYRVDDGDWISIQSQSPFALVDNLDVGSYDIHIRSVDTMGNDNETSISVEVVSPEPIVWNEIYTLDDLDNVRNNLSGNHKLMNDIDASETRGWNDGAGFLPIGNTTLPDHPFTDLSEYFTGSFNGNNYSINDLFINYSYEADEGDPNNFVGLFSIIWPGTEVYDLNIVDAEINGWSNIPYLLSVGGLAGVNYGGFITSCTMTGEVNSDDFTGMVAYNLGLISDCDSRLNVSGPMSAGLVSMNFAIVDRSESSGIINGEIGGGLIGYNYGEIRNSHSSSVVNVKNGGGLIGLNLYTVENSHATGDVHGSDDEEFWGGLYIGGLIGINLGIVNSSYASGDVSGHKNVGGLVGHNGESEVFAGMIPQNSISNSYSLGNVSGNESVGGLIGYNNVYVNDSYYTGDVVGKNIVGGLIGHNGPEGEVRGAYVIGTVNGGPNGSLPEEGAGGLIGLNEGLVDETFTNVTVISEGHFTGGLVGQNKGIISQSTSIGDVEGNRLSVGGLIGFNSGTVSKCSATGSVGGDSEFAGGLVGFNSGTISECFAIGGVSGDGYVGGLVGLTFGLVSDSYWDTEASGISVSSGGEGRTSEEMIQQSTFTDWDFDDVWYMDNGSTYPMLQVLTDLAPTLTPVEVSEESEHEGSICTMPFVLISLIGIGLIVQRRLR